MSECMESPYYCNQCPNVRTERGMTDTDPKAMLCAYGRRRDICTFTGRTPNQVAPDWCPKKQKP